MEKGGPPYAADGSLDYAESASELLLHAIYPLCAEFSGAVEDPFSVLSALVPDLPGAPFFTPIFPPLSEGSSQITLPLPIHVPTPQSPPAAPAPGSQPNESTKSKYHYWSVTRPTSQRGKPKDPVEERHPTPEWRKPRSLHTADFGLFPSLAINLSSGGTPEVLATQERLFEALHTSLESAVRSQTDTNPATAAQSWLQEIVYGGFDGLAYMRSIAEFITQNPDTSDRADNTALAEYVDAVLIDELTERRHRAVEAALTENSVPVQNFPVITPTPKPSVVPLTQLDLGSLISTPNELFDAENVWVGAGANEDSAVLARALDHASHLLERLNARRANTGEAGMDVDSEENAGKERDLERELRMNLIALAKRAPLDQIERMPPELVPPHLRHVVPTIRC
jgi:bromodomain-containing protein 7/9